MPETYFYWDVIEGGYNWVKTNSAQDGDAGRQQFLTSDWNVKVQAQRKRRYRPLVEHTGLFKILAETEPNPGSIKRFSDRFGPLLGGHGSMIKLPHRPLGKGYQGGWGEPLSIWQGTIMKLRMATSLWDMAQHGDLAKLRDHIVWHEERVAYHGHPASKATDGAASIAVIASTTKHEDLFRSMTRGDLIRPALTFVQSTINNNLADSVAPRLLWDEHYSDLSVDLVPKHLLGAIWLQFANAVERNSELRKCVECGTWFAVSPTTARSDKLYCSTACRTKAYRRRQTDAVRLHDKGIPVKEIAAKLEADPKAVHGWLTRSRRGNSARRTKKNK